MPQAIVDPDELDAFAMELNRFNSVLRDSAHRVRGRFNELGTTWRDQEQRRFAAEFEQMIVVIDRFLQVSDQQVPLLRRKATKAREYLTQR